MKLVIDANVVISALIADSKTRELIVTLEPDLLTPAFVHDEVENYEDLIVEKSGMEPDRVVQLSTSCSSTSRSSLPTTSIRLSRGQTQQSETPTPTTCCTSLVRSPAMGPSGAMILTSTNRT